MNMATPTVPSDPPPEPTPTPTPSALPNTPLTFSPDPQHLLAGAGTAAVQAARGREYRSGGDGIGYVTVQPGSATGVVVGVPGVASTWTPPTAYVPATMPATGIVASPATAWLTGQFARTRDGADCYWNGTAVNGGVAP